MNFFPCSKNYTFREDEDSSSETEEELEETRHSLSLGLDPPVYRPSFDVTHRPPDMATRLSLERPSLDYSHFQAGSTNAKEKWKTIMLLSFNTLGVIYGDIGTSPLYVVSTVFSGIDATTNNIIGCISLIIWVVFLLVTIKYITFILRADNKGEGGTFALLGLLNGEYKVDASIDVEHATSKTSPNVTSDNHNNDTNTHSHLKKRKWWQKVVPFVAIISASFVLADGALTPAISVLSAIEGLEVFDAGLSSATVPITVVIIFLLFMFQRVGTAKVAFAFAPVTFLWFSSIASIGIYNVVQYPGIYLALNPAQGIEFLARNGPNSLSILGGVFLSVTGLEALYADLGHFGAVPIRISWTTFVLPSLILQYLGQGASLLLSPDRISDPFFSSIPTPVYWPMLILATLATVIASQAMITGSASLVSQAAALGLFPPVSVIHTSKKIFGQIYVPELTYFQMVITILIVVGFQSSANIANAYGVTVSGGELATTILFTIVLLTAWKLAWWKALFFPLIFASIDAIFFAANLTKIPRGGWVSIVFAFTFSALMLSWTIGQGQVRHLKRRSPNLSIADVKALLKGSEKGPAKIVQVPCMGVFITGFKRRTPPAFINMMRSMNAIPETVVFLTVETAHQPFITRDQTLKLVKNYGNGFFRIRSRLGYADTNAEILNLLSLAEKVGLPQYNQDDITYFISHEHIYVGTKSIIKIIPYYIYTFLKRMFKYTPSIVKIPDERMIEVGIPIKLT